LRARRDNDEELGLVTEIGVKGLCIRGQKPLNVGDAVMLHIELPAPLTAVGPFVVEAECRWSALKDNAGIYESGLKFRTSSVEQIDVLGMVLRAFTYV
jgi:hypothetical protein